MIKISKYELRIYPYACSGESCFRCEELMPGFVTENGGKLQLSEEELKEKDDVITEMLAECPTSALSLDEI